MTPETLVVKTAHVVNSNLWRCFPVINVDKTKDIPTDYPGAMGVPITFMDKFSSEQFEILDITKHVKLQDGRMPYRRIVIRNLHPTLPEEIDLAAWFRRMGVPLDVEFIETAGGMPPDAMAVYRRKPEEGTA